MSEKVALDKIVIDGVTFVPAADAPKGNRCVIVVDRGWIFAGDVTREDGKIKLRRAVHVLRWEGIGFDGMLASPKGGKVVLKAINQTITIPEDSEIFCVAVCENWGL